MFELWILHFFFFLILFWVEESRVDDEEDEDVDQSFRFYIFVIKEVLKNRMIICGVATQHFLNKKWKNNLFLQVLKDKGLE